MVQCGERKEYERQPELREVGEDGKKGAVVRRKGNEGAKGKG